LINILVIGGAGYIGSHMVNRLLEAGFSVTVADNLSSGNAEAVAGAQLMIGDIADPEFIDAVLTQAKPAAVMHFAALIEVAESVRDPARYYRNNVHATQVLLDAMRTHGVTAFLFSSTAAIFGNPMRVPIDESHPCQPINPYGRSKLMVEQMLGDYAQAYGLRAICLRYFNAAGAHPDGSLGECHEPESHLIPLVLQVAANRRANIAIYGSDYPTPDGSCVRDYVHVLDLCEAHLLALGQLLDGASSAQYNLGNGIGFSVLEVINTARRVTGHVIPAAFEPRRAGDSAILVADASLAKQKLGWHPKHHSLAQIISDAWAWERRFPWWRLA
jgi:UDP-glucose 4-epimerase